MEFKRFFRVFSSFFEFYEFYKFSRFLALHELRDATKVKRFNGFLLAFLFQNILIGKYSFLMVFDGFVIELEQFEVHVLGNWSICFDFSKGEIIKLCCQG